MRPEIGKLEIKGGLESRNGTQGPQCSQIWGTECPRSGTDALGAPKDLEVLLRSQHVRGDSARFPPGF